MSRLIEESSCKKIALKGEIRVKEFSFQENENYFKEHSFEILTVNSEIPDVDALLGPIEGEQVNIMIDCASPPCVRPSCFSWDGVFGILILGIPSWIMFLIVGIWGRKK